MAEPVTLVRYGMTSDGCYDVVAKGKTMAGRQYRTWCGVAAVALLAVSTAGCGGDAAAPESAEAMPSLAPDVFGAEPQGEATGVAHAISEAMKSYRHQSFVLPLQQLAYGNDDATAAHAVAAHHAVATCLVAKGHTNAEPTASDVQAVADAGRDVHRHEAQAVIGLLDENHASQDEAGGAAKADVRVGVTSRIDHAADVASCEQDAPATIPASHPSGADALPEIPSDALMAIQESYSEAMDSGQGRDLIQVWASCMTEAGFSVTHPDDVSGNVTAAGDTGGSDTSAAAVDVGCKNSSGYTAGILQLAADRQTAWIADNPEVANQLDHHQHVMNWAVETYLADNNITVPESS